MPADLIAWTAGEGARHERGRAGPSIPEEDLWNDGCHRLVVGEVVRARREYEVPAVPAQSRMTRPIANGGTGDDAFQRHVTGRPLEHIDVHAPVLIGRHERRRGLEGDEPPVGTHIDRRRARVHHGTLREGCCAGCLLVLSDQPRRGQPEHAERQPRLHRRTTCPLLAATEPALNSAATSRPICLARAVSKDRPRWWWFALTPGPWAS